MKKFITLLTSCSLTLAAVALGQQTAEQTQAQSTPTTSTQNAAGQTAGQTSTATEKASPAQSKRQQRRHARQEAKSGNEENATTASGGTTSEEETGKHHGKNRRNANASETNASASASPASAENENAGGKKQGKGHKGRNARNEANATATPNVTGAGAAAAGAATGAAAAHASPSATVATQTNTAPTTAASPNTATTTNTANTANAGGGRRGRKVDAQAVQTIKSQHASFRAQPRPDKVPAVSFNQNHHIEGAEQWQGPQYNVYRTYHPEMHDRNWYHSHYQRVELIGGGYYYYNNGYWFPAWGYDQSAQYYPYDAPIYVGSRAEPPDRVIADVQAVLQEEGYYTGEVDGLLGPLTRQALVDYQKDNGLYATAVIDEPTLESLNLSS